MDDIGLFLGADESSSSQESLQSIESKVSCETVTSNKSRVIDMIRGDEQRNTLDDSQLELLDRGIADQDSTEQSTAHATEKGKLLKESGRGEQQFSVDSIAIEEIVEVTLPRHLSKDVQINIDDQGSFDSVSLEESKEALSNDVQIIGIDQGSFDILPVEETEEAKFDPSIFRIGPSEKSSSVHANKNESESESESETRPLKSSPESPLDKVASGPTIIGSDKSTFESMSDHPKNSIWWLDILQKEGLFNIDTTTAFPQKSTAQADNVSAKSSLFRAESISVKSAPISAENQDNIAQSGVDRTENIGQVDDDDHSSADDESIMSIIAEDDAVSEEDWRERLWIVARQHWSTGARADEKVKEHIAEEEVNGIAAEIASVAATLDQDTNDRDDVLKFRNQLCSCLEAYVEVFHDSPTSAEEDTPKKDNSISTQISDTPEDDTDDNRVLALNSFRGTTSSAYEWPPTAARVSPYVPVPIVRLLFREVLYNVGGSLDKAGGCIDLLNTTGSDTTVERIMQAILSSDFDGFRRYTVQAKPPVNEEDNQSLESTNLISRKRIRKVAKKPKLKESDVEDFLYGEMFAAEEGEEEEKEQEKQRIEVEEEENEEEVIELEEEVRLCSGAMEYLHHQRRSRQNAGMENNWKSSFAHKVLIQSLVEQQDTQIPAAEEFIIESDTAINSPSDKEDCSLAYMYAVRYLPHFLIRVTCPYEFSDAFRLTSYQTMVQYFYNVSFVRKRLVVLGIYNGVMVHMEELDAFFDAFRNSACKATDWEIFYRHVYRSLTVCLEDMMMESMELAGFFIPTIRPKITPVAHVVSEGASATAESEIEKNEKVNTGRDKFDLESDHAQIVSSCLEIGRSLHFLGVTLGRREQEKLRKVGDLLLKVTRNYDEEMTEIEISAYRLARNAYQGALKTLKRAEGLILSGKNEYNATRRKSTDALTVQIERARSLEHIREARVTVELYLADTLTTLGYCHEAKLRDYSHALQAYRESLAFYTRHAGKTHTAFIHTLQSVGCVCVEIKEWQEALQSFNQCLSLMRQRGMTTLNISREHSEEMASVLKAVGTVFVELFDYDAAVEHFNEAMARMRESLESSEFPASLPVDLEIPVRDTPAAEAFVHSFFCDVMSKLADICLIQASKLRLNHYKKRIAIVNVEGGEINDASIDMIRVNQLQLERNAMQWLKESVAMRKKLQEPSHKGCISSISKVPIAIEDDKGNLVDFALDLLNLGKLHFRRCEYDMSISNWTEAGTILQCILDMHTEPVPKANYMVGPLIDIETSRKKNRGIDYFIEVLYLLGEVYMRLGENEKALIYFDDSLDKLKQKRGYSTRASESISVYEDSCGSKALPSSRKPISTLRTKSHNQDATNPYFTAGLDLDIGHCVHSIGLTYFNSSQFERAISCFEEALRYFDASKTSLQTSLVVEAETTDSRNDDVDRILSDRQISFVFSLDNAVASAKQSLGRAYHEQHTVSKAVESLEDSVLSVEGLATRIPQLSTDNLFAIPTSIFRNKISLVTSIISLGDTYRRLANINMSQGFDSDAMMLFESSIKVLENGHKGGRVAVESDDEYDLEAVDGEKVDAMLTNCYDQMLILIYLRDKVRGSSSSPLFTREDILFRLGNIYAKKSMHAPALEYYLEAKQILEEKFGTPDHKIIGNIQFNLGNLYKDISNSVKGQEKSASIQKAVNCFEDSLRISQLMQNSNQLEMVESLESLGALYMLDDDYRKENNQQDVQALKLFRKAITIRLQGRQEMTLSNAQAMHNLGALLLRKLSNFQGSLFNFRLEKELEEVVEMLTQSVKFRSTVLGDHLDVANTSHSLGVALWLQTKLPQVIGSPMMESTFQHALDRFGDALYIRQKFLKSVPVRSALVPPDRRELSTRADVYDVIEVIVQVLYDVGSIHQARRDYGEASKYFNEAMTYLQLLDKSSTEMQGDQHTEETQMLHLQRNTWSAKIYLKIAGIDQHNGNYNKAIEGFETSLKKQGPNPVENVSAIKVFNDYLKGVNTFLDLDDDRSLHGISVTVRRMAPACEMVGRHVEALKCYAVCLCLYLILYGEESQHVVDVLDRAGSLYFKTEEFSLCIALLRKAFIIRQIIGHERDPTEDEAVLRMNLGQAILSSEGDNREALLNFNAAVAIAEQLDDEGSYKNEQTTQKEQNGGATETGKEVTTKCRSKMLLTCYEAILLLMRRETSGTEEDEGEIAEVMHHIGNLQASLQRYEDAITSFSEVLQFQRSQNGDDHVNIADLLFNLGNIYLETGKIQKARECHEECHRVTVLALGDSSAELAENMICMGHVEFRCYDYEAALDWYDRALHISRFNGEKHEIAVGKVLHRKGLAHDKLGDHEKAIESFGEMLKLGRKLWGRDHMELSNVLNSLGNAHRNRSEFSRGLRCYEESLRIRLKNGEELSVANTKNNIGAVLIATEQTHKAKAFYADALRIKTEKLGEEHIETARTLYNMGQVYMEEHNTTIGIKFVQQALMIFKARLGSNHYEVAACFYNIGVTYGETGRAAEAIKSYKGALDIFRTNPEQNSAILASTLHNIGVIVEARKDYTLAIRFFSEALGIRSDINEQDNIVDTQYRLANLLSISGDTTKSLEMHYIALDARRQQHEDGHGDLADSLYAVAQLLYAKGLCQDAFDCIKECFDVRLLLYGKVNIHTIDAALLLANLSREVGKFEESLSLLTYVLNARISSNGSDSLAVASVRFDCGIVLCEMMKYEEAIQMYEESLRVRTLELAPNHLDIAVIMENVGIVEQKRGNHKIALRTFKKALDIKRYSLKENDADICAIIHSMGKSYFELEEFDIASRLFGDTIVRKRAIFGFRHAEVARALLDHAALFFRTGDHKRSLKCYVEVIHSNVLDTTSWEVGQIYMQMGLAYLSQTESLDAFDSLMDAMHVFEESLKSKEGGIGLQEKSDAQFHELIQCYRSILEVSELNPNLVQLDKPGYHSKIAHAFVKVKDYRTAANVYRSAIEFQRKNNEMNSFTAASNLHNMGNCLYELGELNDSVVCLEEALLIFKETDDVEDCVIADTYHCLGLVHQERSDFKKALKFYDSALNCRRKMNDTEKSGLASTLHSMGVVLYSLGMYEASLKSCGEALRLPKRRSVEQIAHTAGILASIGMNHRDKGEYEKALKCLKESLRQRMLIAGEYTLIVGRTLHDIGTVYGIRGEEANSKSFSDEALRVFGKIALSHFGGLTLRRSDSSGGDQARITIDFEEPMTTTDIRRGLDTNTDPIKVGETVLVLGTLLDHNERFEEATRCIEYSLYIFREKLSPDHLMIAEADHLLGSLYSKLGKHEEARRCLLEAFQLRKIKLGALHPRVGETSRLLGQICGALGRAEDALYYFKHALGVQRARKLKKFISSDEIDMLLKMGKLLLDELKFDEALSCFTESLKLQKSINTNSSKTQLAEIWYLIGSTLFEKGEYDASHSRLILAKNIIEESEEVGNDELLCRVYYSVGQVYQRQNSNEHARDAYTHCLKIISSIDEPDKIMVARVLLGIGMVHLVTNNYKEALSYTENAKTKFIEVTGGDPIELASYWYALGKVHRTMNGLTDARDCFRASLDINREYLDEDDNTDFYDPLHSLGTCLSDLKEYNDANSCLTEALRIGVANCGIGEEKVGETYRCLAHVCRQLGELNSSLDHYEQAIALGMSCLNAANEVDDGAFSKISGCFEAAITLAEPDGNLERLGKLHHKRGTLQSMKKQHNEALKSYTEAVRLYKHCYGGDHIAVANALFNIGVCLNETGDPDRAITCLNRALKISQSQLGDNHLDVADTMQQLGASYRLKYDVVRALEWCRQAMRIRKNKEDSAFSSLLQLNGQLNCDASNYDEGERCFRECVRIRRRVHGNTHSDIADSLFSLGYVYENFKEDPRALRCYEDCLRIRKSLVGDIGLDIAKTYLHLGCVHVSIANEAKAVFCFDKCVSICSTEEEPHDQQCDLTAAAALVNKGRILQSQSKHEEALEYYEGALELRRKHAKHKEQHDISEEAADMFRMKALAYESLNRDKDALFNLNAALAMYKTTLGGDHLSTAATLQLLADHHLMKRNNDDAIQHAKEALRIRQTALGDMHEDTGDSYFTLGVIHFTENDFKKSIPCFEAALSAFTKSRGELHLSVADTLYYIACIHERYQNKEQAIKCYQGSLSGRQYSLGKYHVRVADIFFKLGMLHQADQDLDLASGCLHQCLRIREKVLPEDHLDIGDTLFYVAGVMVDRGNNNNNDQDKLETKKNNEEPIQFYIDAIRIYKKHLGDNHISIAKCLASLGSIFEDEGGLALLEKAGNCYQRAVAIFDSHLNEHPTEEEVSSPNLQENYQALAGTLLDWATYLDWTGIDKAAMKVYHRALKLYRLLLGPDNEIIATTLCNIANLLGRQERYKEAMPLIDTALKIRIANLGEGHPSVADLLLNCGILHDKNREYSDAISTIQESLRIRRYLRNEVGVAEALTHLGRVQGNFGKYGNALECWAEALSIYKMIDLPDKDPVVAELVKNQFVAHQMLDKVVTPEED